MRKKLDEQRESLENEDTMKLVQVDKRIENSTKIIFSPSDDSSVMNKGESKLRDSVLLDRMSLSREKYRVIKMQIDIISHRHRHRHYIL